MKRVLTLGVLAALLAGCSQLPTYERPAVAVPAAFPHAAAAAPAADLAWSRYFGDERLQALITRALANNRDLRIAALNVAQARAQADIRQADRLPTVNAVASGSRTPSNSGGINSSYQAGLLVSAWEIDFFGRIASLGEAAVAQYLASEEGRRAAQTTLVAAVATSWLNLAADEELLALTRETLATRTESLRLVRLRFEHGASSELDLRQAESLAETARAALAQAQRQRATDLNALGLLVGEPLPADFSVGITTGQVRLADLPAGLPAEVLVERPDVRQAEQALIAANANIGAARAAFFPRISLTAGVGTASGELSGLFRSGQWGFTVAPQALLPIFDAGRNQANLASAQATRDIAVAQYERAIQQAFREVADALAGRAYLGEQAEAQAKVVQAEEARARLAQLRQQGGVASTLDLLDAQRSLFAAQQALVQVRLARLQSQVGLYKALGGGVVR